jgi:hypothetical protein
MKFPVRHDLCWFIPVGLLLVAIGRRQVENEYKMGGSRTLSSQDFIAVCQKPLNRIPESVIERHHQKKVQTKRTCDSKAEARSQPCNRSVHSSWMSVISLNVRPHIISYHTAGAASETPDTGLKDLCTCVVISTLWFIFLIGETADKDRKMG